LKTRPEKEDPAMIGGTALLIEEAGHVLGHG